MKIKDAINWLNSTDTTTTPPLSVDGVLKLQKAIIEKQAELLEEAKLFIEIKPNTPSETIYLHDKFNILYKLTEAEV